MSRRLILWTRYNSSAVIKLHVICLHHDTATVMVCAGLAWKCHGDLDAESYYASASQSLQFQQNHYEYCQRVFGILTNLFILYHETEKTQSTHMVC